MGARGYWFPPPCARPAARVITFVDHGFVKLKGKEMMVHLYEPKWESR